ncbi:MAG: HIT family protein [Candidatus Heimdallarchaeota archaeon]
MCCIFCKIVQKQSEAAILYEDDEVIAFLDIMPVNEGHCLVIPKTHHKLVEEMNEKTYLKMFSVGRSLLVKIKETLPETTAFNYLLADGKDAGQEIFHVHLHIIPRKPNDGFGFKFGPNYGKKLSLEEKTRIAAKILSYPSSYPV